MPRLAREIDPQLGRNIERERKLEGLTRAEVVDEMRAAGAMHWGPTTLFRIERGEQRLDVEDAGLLVGVIGSDYLVGTSLGNALQLHRYEEENESD